MKKPKTRIKLLRKNPSEDRKKSALASLTSSPNHSEENLANTSP
jgi:hypothetical protein